MSGDFFQGLLWFCIGLVVLALSSKYSMGTLSEPGPGALPFGLGIILVLLSSILLFRSWLFKGHVFERRLPFGPRYGRVFLIILFLALDTFLLESLGYLLSIFLAISIAMFIMEPRRWVSSLLFGAIASLLSYALFDIWLNVSLPKGIFYF